MSTNATQLASCECADGALVTLTVNAEPGEPVLWVVACYPSGEAPDDRAEYMIVRQSERLARLAYVGLIVERGGAS
jgi:hypothetical protein